MDFSGYLDVIVVGAGVMLLLSILDEAAVEFLKSLADRKVGAFKSYPAKMTPWLIGQRYWYAAVGSIIEETCGYVVREHWDRLKIPWQQDQGLAGPAPGSPEDAKRGVLIGALRIVLAADSPGGVPRDPALSAEGLANIKEEQFATALSAWIKSRIPDQPPARADFEASWLSVEPLVRAFVASRYQLMRKAYQNRLRLIATFVGFLMAAGLSLSGQFSLYAYITSLTRDPAARKAAAAWFSDDKNVEEYRKRLGAAAQSLEESAKAVARQADTALLLPGAHPGEAAGRLAAAAEAAEKMTAAADALSRRSAELVAAAPTRALGGLAEPLWRAGIPFAGLRPFLCAWLDIFGLTLLLSFGSENWHDILNAALSVRRQFGGGASK